MMDYMVKGLGITDHKYEDEAEEFSERKKLEIQTS